MAFWRENESPLLDEEERLLFLPDLVVDGHVGPLLNVLKAQRDLVAPVGHNSANRESAIIKLRLSPTHASSSKLVSTNRYCIYLTE